MTVNQWEDSYPKRERSIKLTIKVGEGGTSFNLNALTTLIPKKTY